MTANDRIPKNYGVEVLNKIISTVIAANP